MLSFEQIKELIELVSAHGLKRLEVERSGFKLVVSGGGEGTGQEAPTEEPPGIVEPGTPGPVKRPASRVEPAAAARPTPRDAELPEDQHLVKSPIVGTFYAAPSPDAEPFVRVGDRVRKGQVLCIVEAMKLMNEIESDMDGEVAGILPKNAQPVEYGEPLFAIKVS